MKENKDAATLIGKIFATCLLACLGTCVISVAIALTIKLIAFIF